MFQNCFHYFVQPLYFEAFQGYIYFIRKCKVGEKINKCFQIDSLKLSLNMQEKPCILSKSRGHVVGFNGGSRIEKAKDY